MFDFSLEMNSGTSRFLLFSALKSKHLVFQFVLPETLKGSPEARFVFILRGASKLKRDIVDRFQVSTRRVLNAIRDAFRCRRGDGDVGGRSRSERQRSCSQCRAVVCRLSGGIWNDLARNP